MSDPFANLVERTGHSMPEWIDEVGKSGLNKHSDIVTWLKTERGLTHGFANGIALAFRNRDVSPEDDDLVAAQYSGAKTALRPIYESLVKSAILLGDDVEIAPKKSSVSLRRSKQFALVEAPSAKRIQLGLQLPGEPTTDRLQSGNTMCSHRVSIVGLEEIDDELLGWLRDAYLRA